MRLTAICASILLVTAAAADARRTDERPPARPTPLAQPGAFFGPDAYPPIAIRLGEEGRVVMRLAVDQTGRVADCAITSSSGSTALDAQSCRIARTRVTFAPARDATGRPVASDYVLPVRWQLPPGAAGPVDLATGPRLREEIAVEVAIDPAGKVVACRNLALGTPPEAVNGCSTLPAGAKIERGYTRAGRPVGAKIVQRFSREVTPDP